MHDHRLQSQRFLYISVKVVGSEKQGGQKGGECSIMVSDRGDRGLFAILTCSFRLKSLFSFSLVQAKFIDDYFEIKLYGANCLVRQYINSR